MKLSIKTTGLVEAQRGLQQLAKQMPFAMATALNKTANAVQSEVRTSLNDRFTLRKRTFIEQSIYRNRATDFATKTKFSATVRVNPARDVLAKHEAGGVKTPINGKYLTLPLPAVRRSKKDLILDSQKPRALIGKRGVFKRGDVLVKETGRGKTRKLTALYLFKRRAIIRPRLGMVATADKVVPDVWPDIAGAAIASALRTAR